MSEIGTYHRCSALISATSQNAIFFPARTTEGKDVLIRLVAKGGQGLQHAKILEALKELDVEEKHVLPLLELLHHEDMVFAVFPLVASNDNGSWFSDLAEVFDYLQQLFEVSQPSAPS